MIDINSPRTIARWLRRCVDDMAVMDKCDRCPFGIFTEDGSQNCVDLLHRKAAEQIERAAGIRREGAYE